MIRRVPLQCDNLWLECTNPQLTFGYIHNAIAGHQALLITEDGGQLTHLPTYQDSLNTQEKSAVVTLEGNGSARIEVRESARLFQYESTNGFAKLDDNRQKEYIRKNLGLRNAVIGEIRVNETKESSPQIDIDYTLQTSQYGNKTGNRLFIPANIFRQSGVPTNSKEREQDVHIGYGYKDTDHIKLIIPEGYAIEAMPQNITIDNKFGSFVSTITPSEETIDITHCLTIQIGRASCRERVWQYGDVVVSGRDRRQ